MQDNLFQSVEDLAASLVGGVASFLGYGADEISDPPIDGSVKLPDDLFAQASAQTEWWYYTGHCKTAKGREFGFEFVFFKRRTGRDKLGGLPMTVVGNPLYFAHFAVSDVSAQTFRYEHIRSFGTVIDLAASMSETAFDVRLGDWSVREIAGKHILHAVLEDGLTFDAVLETTKPIVMNGDRGITRKKNGASKHFSFTRMNVDGQFSENGEIDTFSGSAWMDREFGSWEQGNWDWYSIQFDDDTELMLYQFQDESGDFNGESTGTYVRSDGECVYLRPKDFEIKALSTWISPRTGAVYPADWQIRVPSLDIDVVVTPMIADQELDTRGTTMIVYWEGACAVTGIKGEAVVAGRAYVELVGYDRSHETAGITDFLFGRTILKIKDVLA